MSTMEQIAAIMNGREYGEELSREEEERAKAAGLIIVFGASDDLTEFRGALHDEAGAYDGAEHTILQGPLLAPSDDDFDADEAVRRGWMPPDATAAVKVNAEWCPDGFAGSWRISTDAPHATFDIMEDGELYCRGVVFHAPSLPPPQTGDNNER